MGFGRVGRFPFFPSSAGNDLISDAIRLGLIFKTSPMDFADLPQEVLEALIERTAEVLESER